MKRTITWQLGVIIIGIIIAMLIITSVATYKTAYDKLYEAAGIEAYGCANITTGLITEDTMRAVLKGDEAAAQALSTQLNWTTGHKAIFETQYIIDQTGTILALDDHLKDKGFSVGDSFYIDEEAISTLTQTGHPTYSKVYEYGGMSRLSGYAPIYVDGEIAAVSVIDFNGNIVSERTWDVVKNGILISLIPMALASIVTVWLIRRKTKPISALIDQAKEIADGNLSVVNKYDKTQDEIGDLARTLNGMAANFRNVMGTLKETAEQLAQNSTHTAESLTEMKTSVQQVSASMGEVASSVSDGTVSAEQSNDLLQELASLIQTGKQKADVSVHHSEKTMETAEEGRARVEDISRDMEKIQRASSDTSRTIQQLSESTAKINQIAGTIASIAAQTNLLALNASIEAARAGEHGKGFAVVAEEVRKLAEQSNDEVLQVEKLVRDIIGHTEHVVQAMNENTSLVEAGNKTVQFTAQALTDIHEAVSQTMHEIDGVSRLTHEEAVNSARVVELISQLAAAIREIEDRTVDISAAAQQTSSAIESVADRSVQTSLVAGKLKGIVAQFRL
ncbi:methyl-accepting chemotaxis protein [Domibacillus sp. DTU_2020_1001157_1_SI_ALB_TIR_016]|uniref:methyl-accepting chemotaxis protein n=1 Tax=Domibacillus sp. DTU_2020_1001157_1_SI_ALB_TIR_016 TaxID=3077789 RepID=UPI0028E492FF|nr:methyl-accepting chemotaxis protein [Domibacillus sp. DTU_2020_1001157_1_SI_ALB_TIR_016]WNS80262.1 methyl-accepting chemotaxis protein [Domibacillus sp. DTU_2020_1001157_1_SI_ALB_TIR_016]